jgi:hypothetical protein
MLVAELGGGKAPLRHGHERLCVPGLERELELRVKARSVQARFGRGEHEAVGALDYLEHVPVPVELAG